jgi:hypothetical protein
LKTATTGCTEMSDLNTNQYSGIFLKSEDLNFTPLQSNRIYGNFISKVFMQYVAVGVTQFQTN